MQYYILDLSNVKAPREDIVDPRYIAEPYPLVNPKVIDYVIREQFACMDPDNLDILSNNLNQTFQETLRDVFVTFLDMEHEVTRRTCYPKKEGEEEELETNSFIESYLQQIQDCKDSNKKEKCHDLVVLHNEDIQFLYWRDDDFLSSVNRWSGRYPMDILQQNQRENKYKQVVILLNSNSEYLGHIYMWSWLSMNNRYLGGPFKIEFGGIRTNLRNLLCGGTKGIAPLLVNIVKDWTAKYGWNHVQVAFKPIGAMPGYLVSCGLSRKTGEYV